MTTKKIVIVGNSGVGKSTLIQRITENIFYPNYYPNELTNIYHNNEFTFYDISGIDSYNLDFPENNIDICVIMYDTHNKSPNNVSFWIDAVKHYGSSIVIVGNKNDLIECNTANTSGYNSINISVKTNNNIDRFLDIIRS
jgi:small GTP-binding protein